MTKKRLDRLNAKIDALGNIFNEANEQIGKLLEAPLELSSAACTIFVPCFRLLVLPGPRSFVSPIF